MKKKTMVGLIAIVASAAIFAGCVEKEEVTPSTPTSTPLTPTPTMDKFTGGQEKSDPHIRPATPSVKYEYHKGFLLGASASFVIENRGGAGPVQLIWEIGGGKWKETKEEFLWLEAGEEREVSVWVDGGKHKYGGSDVKLTAFPAPFTVDSLLQDLNSKYLEVRKNATILLGDLQVKKAVEPLIKILEDDESCVMRKEAARALGKIKDERAVEPLINALEDDEKSVKEAAIEALGEIGDKKAVEPLIELLEDDNSWIRMKTAYALGEIKDERAIEPLEEVAQNDKSRLARDAANSALEEIRKKG